MTEPNLTETLKGHVLMCWVQGDDITECLDRVYTHHEATWDEHDFRVFIAEQYEKHAIEFTIHTSVASRTAIIADLVDTVVMVDFPAGERVRGAIVSAHGPNWKVCLEGSDREVVCAPTEVWFLDGLAGGDNVSGNVPSPDDILAGRA